MSRETKWLKQRALALCSLCPLLSTPPEGPVVAHDCLWDISEGSRKQSLLSFRGKPVGGSPPPFLSQNPSFVQPQMLWAPGPVLSPEGS